jgi:tetratricopeptide (TPR) repeat protein
MTMHGRIGMWSRKTLFTASALALLAGGCASTKSADKQARAPLPDEEGWTPGEAPKPGSAVTASTAPAEIPLSKKKPSGRQITEEQKADFEKAAADYQKAKKSGPLTPGDCSSLANTFKKLADRSPAMLEARNNEATIYLECGRKDEAVSIWNNLASGVKPYAPALANLGYLAWQGKNKSSAESYFNRSVQADPLIGSIFARINLAQIMREQARTASSEQKRSLNDQAVRHLRTVLALDGNSLQAYAGLTYIYFDLGLPEAAKLVGAQAIKRAKEIATGKFEDESTAAEEVAKKGRKGKAKKEKDKEDAKEDGAKSADDESVGGIGYTTEMKKAVAVVYNTLGMINLSKKSYTEAIKNYTHAVAADPTLYEARLNLAALSLKFRNYEIAEQNLREVLKAQSRNYEAIIGLGVALRGNKKFDEAEAEYNRAMQMEPQRPEAYFNLGVLYQEYKGGSDKPMLQKAQGYYRDYLSRSQSPKMRKDAEKRIKDIDDTFAALKEAEQMMKEAEEMQRKAEAQQKVMEEQMKKQEADEKARAEAEKKKAEEDKIKAEADKKKAEEDKIKKAEEDKKKAEEDKKKAEEDKIKKAEDKKKAEEEKAKKAEEEKAKKAEDKKKAEEEKAKKAEEEKAKKAEEKAKKAEEKAKKATDSSKPAAKEDDKAGSAKAEADKKK